MLPYISFPMHVVQMLLLVVVAAPLLVLGTPRAAGAGDLRAADPPAPARRTGVRAGAGDGASGGVFCPPLRRSARLLPHRGAGGLDASRVAVEPDQPGFPGWSACSSGGRSSAPMRRPTSGSAPGRRLVLLAGAIVLESVLGIALVARTTPVAAIYTLTGTRQGGAIWWAVAVVATLSGADRRVLGMEPRRRVARARRRAQPLAVAGGRAVAGVGPAVATRVSRAAAGSGPASASSSPWPGSSPSPLRPSPTPSCSAPRPPAVPWWPRAPPQVVLTFGETVQAPPAAIEVFSADGRQVRTGPVEHPAGRGNQVGVTLPPSMKGTYVVSWRVDLGGYPPGAGSVHLLGRRTQRRRRRGLPRAAPSGLPASQPGPGRADGSAPHPDSAGRHRGGRRGRPAGRLARGYPAPGVRATPSCGGVVVCRHRFRGLGAGAGTLRRRADRSATPSAPVSCRRSCTPASGPEQPCASRPAW